MSPHALKRCSSCRSGVGASHAWQEPRISMRSRERGSLCSLRSTTLGSSGSASRRKDDPSSGRVAAALKRIHWGALKRSHSALPFHRRVALGQSALGPKISHLSKGGGTSLELPEGQELPGMKALGWAYCFCGRRRLTLERSGWWSAVERRAPRSWGTAGSAGWHRDGNRQGRRCPRADPFRLGVLICMRRATVRDGAASRPAPVVAVPRSESDRHVPSTAPVPPHPNHNITS